MASLQQQLLDAVHRNDSQQVRSLLNDEQLARSIVNNDNAFTNLLAISAQQPSHNVLEALLDAAFQYGQRKHIVPLLATHIHNCTAIQQQSRNQNNNSQQHNHQQQGQQSGEELKAHLAKLSLNERMQLVLDAVRNGEVVIVVDAADRENEGDLIIAAEHATAEKVAFIVNHTSGLICVGVTDERCKQLKLQPMVAHNTESHGTAFTVSVDYNVGTTTGISAGDRAATIRALADESIDASFFNSPGHMFPLRAKAGGVIERPGHTEASVDLPRLAGLYPAGAMCEIVKQDGAMVRPQELYEFAADYNLAIINIADIIEYRKQQESGQVNGRH